MLALLRDICASVAQAGIIRLVFFNGHGGNTAVLKIAARDARITHNLICAHASWFIFADLSRFDPIALAYDLHAGDTETSAIFATHTDLVDMEQASDFLAMMQLWQQASHFTGLTGQPARPGWITDDLNPEGTLENASAASVEMARALVDGTAAGFALV